MTESKTYYYNKIEEAIEFIQKNFKQQPSLEEIAESIHMSPFHFQRLFTEWAGTSPKNFLQYTTINYAKRLLNKQQTLFDTAYDSGLSGTSRLHDLFVKIEGMTPGDYQNGGNKLTINYSFHTSIFGKIITGATSKGICHLMFYSDDEEAAFDELKIKFPKANYRKQPDEFQLKAIQLFQETETPIEQLKLHLKGTDFQLKVWSALLNIPFGELTTYGDLAKTIEQPSAARAVGTAIGSNPIAFLIPCHRVIQQSGNLGGYMWGPTRKQAILCWEACKTNG